MRNSNKILEDQTSVRKIVTGSTIPCTGRQNFGDANADARNLFVVANLLVFKIATESLFRFKCSASCR